MRPKKDGLENTIVVIRKNVKRKEWKGIMKRSNQKSTTDEFVRKAKLIHENKYDYSNVNYSTSHIKVEIICKTHGSFFQKPNGHLSGYGCVKCAPIERKQNKPKSTNQFIEDAKRIHGDVYDYSMVDYKSAHKKVEIICLKHGSFYQKPLGHLNGKGCLFCVHIVSKPESKFLDYLHIPENKHNRQKYINGYKVDGIKNNKIFEFLGDYFHGNPKKYDLSHYNQICHKTFGELYDKTIEKFSKLNGTGYSIYYMWENDWNSWNKNKRGTFPIKKYNGNTI